MTAFNADQYRCVVERLAEGRSAEHIVARLNKAPGVKFTVDDVATLRRHHLPPNWQEFFDQWRTMHKSGAPDEELIIANLRDKADNYLDIGGVDALKEARALYELASKMESGFFAAKAKADAGVSSGSEDHGDGTITWKVIKPIETTE